MQQQLAVIAGCDGDPNVKLDGCRHYEAVVVVGVLPYEVDAPRGSINTRATAITLAEFLL